MHAQSQSCLTLWPVALQAPQAMGFCRQEYWSGLPRPPSRGFSDPGMEPTSLALLAESLPLHRQASRVLFSCYTVFVTQLAATY